MDLAAAYPEFGRWMWGEQFVERTDLAALAASGDVPLASHLGASVLSAVALTSLRYLLETVVFLPLASRLFRCAAPPPLPGCTASEMEGAFSAARGGSPDIGQVKALATATQRTVEELNAWFRARASSERASVKVQRFAESSWRLAVYAVAFGLGLSVSMGQPWFRDTALCWTDLGSHVVDAPLRNFYVNVELPIYLHLVISQLWDARRSDFWEMFLHHVLCILLLSFSYLGNFVRIGCLVLLCHDLTDLFLESSKICRYLRWQRLCDFLFAGFGAAWLLARLYLFPTALMRSALVESVEAGVIGSSWYFFNGLLLLILCLNLFWGRIISTVLYRVLWAGTQDDNGREDDGTLDTETDDSDSSYLSDLSDPGLKRHED